MPRTAVTVPPSLKQTLRGEFETQSTHATPERTLRWTGLDKVL